MVSSSSSNSRLSILNNNTEQTNDYMKQFKPLIPHSTKKTPVLVEAKRNNNILSDVVACLDVRTEDGDDVSINFERALQSMGAKTRRTFSDSVTHLIFKNGSPATLKKALSKNVFIINLLWISRCKQEGKRLPEKEFLIQQPQGLVLTGKKRRKSMEPSKVRALGEPLIFYSPESTSILSKPKEIKKSISESESRKKDIEEAERKDNTQLIQPQPTPCVESKLASSAAAAVIPMHTPNSTVQKQIKARFSIGQSTHDAGHRMPPPESSPMRMKKKRKLTGPRLSVFSTATTKNILNEPSNKPKPHTIVLTSMFTPIRKQCEEAIQKLGHYQLATQVTENTTHVLIGAQRRTTSVILGLLRGAWMLSPEWLIQSVIHNEYIPEQDFELLSWYPRADVSRRGFKLLPAAIRISVYSTTYTADFLNELVQLSGATLIKNHEEADIILCKDNNYPIIEKNKISEDWLLESIEQWRYVPIEKYTLKD